jgi:hypothetical protein
MKKILSIIPYIRYAVFYRENSAHRPGHYYSPVVNLADLAKRKDSIWKKDRDLVGIDLNITKQESFLNDLIKYDKVIPFPEHKNDKHRYFFDNKSYPHPDALALFTMLHVLKPKKLIEVGSGYSSSLILDTKDNFLTTPLELTFIDPNPGILYTLLKKEDYDTTTIIPDIVQNVSLETFKQLEENDILLIDNSHVSKAGSEVNFLMTEVLPILNKGVVVHIHDIFYPFEYPSDWLFKHKLNWNEIYSVHNFLLFNNVYKIIFFSDYIQQKYKDTLQEKAPVFFKERPGSLWIQRVL